METAAALISILFGLSQTPVYTARLRTWGQRIAWCACFCPSFRYYLLHLPTEDAQAVLVRPRGLGQNCQTNIYRVAWRRKSSMPNWRLRGPWFNLHLKHYQVMTLGKLFKHRCLSHQAVNFGTSQPKGSDDLWLLGNHEPDGKYWQLTKSLQNGLNVIQTDTNGITTQWIN